MPNISALPTHIDTHTHTHTHTLSLNSSLKTLEENIDLQGHLFYGPGGLFQLSNLRG